MKSSERQKGIPFLITISYLISFLLIRLMVFLAGAAHTEFAKVAQIGLTPEVRFSIGRNIILFGYHIHHFYFGIFLICVAGWLSIVGSSILSRKQIAVIYGIGLGLFMDEVGLLLTWGDYFSGLSYMLSLLLAGIFLNIVFFPHFWIEVKENLQKPESHSVIRGLLSRNTYIIDFVDKVSEKAGRTKRTSLFFAGVLSLVICVCILFYPKFLRYWIFGAFVIQGLSHLVRAWER